LLVRPEVALKQLRAEELKKDEQAKDRYKPQEGAKTSSQEPVSGGPGEPSRPKRFHGSVELDPARVGRDASRIADEVITHLVGLVGSNVRVTLEIEAEIPSGAPDNVVRTVMENSRTLRFKSQGFEKE
jgi:hypothetical protein